MAIAKKKVTPKVATPRKAPKKVTTISTQLITPSSITNVSFNDAAVKYQAQLEAKTTTKMALSTFEIKAKAFMRKHGETYADIEDFLDIDPSEMEVEKTIPGKEFQEDVATFSNSVGSNIHQIFGNSKANQIFKNKLSKAAISFFEEVDMFYTGEGREKTEKDTVKTKAVREELRKLQEEGASIVATLQAAESNINNVKEYVGLLKDIAAINNTVVQK